MAKRRKAPARFKKAGTWIGVFAGLALLAVLLVSPRRLAQGLENFPRLSTNSNTPSEAENLSVWSNRTDSALGLKDFEARCSSPGVIRCVGFDSAEDLEGGFGDNLGVLDSGASRPALDAFVKASGKSALRLTIPTNSAADTSGSYFMNFSSDLSSQFGENSEFYVQWRQRFSPEILNAYYTGGGGWKQAIIGTGDQPGHKFSSCTPLEVVVQNTYQRGFAQIYNSCTGSQSHGPYDPFQERFGSYDFKLQNARNGSSCLYSQGQEKVVGFFPPRGNCFGYFPDEWMTFQVHVKTGPRVKDEFTNSLVELWIAREGRASELVISFGPYNLTAGPPSENQKFGKIWLLAYHTGKDNRQVHPTAYTWYDELTVSHQRIPDPK